MRSISLATSLAVLLFAQAACAQDLPDLNLPCAPEVTEGRRSVLRHEGVEGIWFHLEVSRCMLGRLSALPRYAERIRLLEERLQLDAQRRSLLQRQVSLAEQEAAAATSALEAAVRGRREAEGSVERERGLRWLWFGVGVVVVVAVEALALWAWSELSD